MLARAARTTIMASRYFISLDRMQKFPIEHYEVGQRLDRYLKKSPIGWAAGQKHLRKKQIIVCQKDGKLISSSNYRFEEGDSLLVSRIFKQKLGKNELDEERSVPRQQANQTLDKMIVYDNQNITIVNKLAGFAVQGGLNAKMNLFSLMSSKYKKQLIHITHRLDRGTSGLVLFAKNKQTAQLVQMSMEDKVSFNKYYLALSQGKQPITKHGYIRGNIEWTNKNKARICSQSQENSKDCITFYAPLQSEKVNLNNSTIYRSLLGVKLLTGRKHQIRCHLSGYLDQPILNDTKYGGSKTKDFSDDDSPIFLHAFGMQIKKRQIVDKIRMNNRFYLNQSLGSVKVTQDSVIFSANLPNYWSQYVKGSYNLQELSGKLSEMEKQSQLVAPKKRKIITIS